jgi:hypothetical protein
MEKDETFRVFAMTVLRRSGLSWRESESWIALLAYLSIAVLPFLFAGVLKGFWGDALNTLFSYIAIGWLLCLFLIITPFRMWRERGQRIALLDDERKPKFSISDPREDFVPWQDAQQGGRVNRHFYLTITNESFGNITRCSVQDARFENNRGHISPITGRHFRLRSERGADEISHTYATSLDMHSRGAVFDVDICSMNEGEQNSRVIMYYATSPTHQYSNEIAREAFPHNLTIRVTADNLANPELRSFRIYIANNGDLRMEVA